MNVKLTNDSQRFQQNEHPTSQTIEHKHTSAYGVGNPGPDLEQAQVVMIPIIPSVLYYHFWYKLARYP